MSDIVGKLHWSIQHRGVGGTLRAAAHALRRKMDPPSACELFFSDAIAWTFACASSALITEPVCAYPVRLVESR